MEMGCIILEYGWAILADGGSDGILGIVIVEWHVARWWGTGGLHTIQCLIVDLESLDTPVRLVVNDIENHIGMVSDSMGLYPIQPIVPDQGYKDVAMLNTNHAREAMCNIAPDNKVLLSSRVQVCRDTDYLGVVS